MLFVFLNSEDLQPEKISIQCKNALKQASLNECVPGKSKLHARHGFDLQPETHYLEQVYCSCYHVLAKLKH